jgi:hypothetical protein
MQKLDFTPVMYSSREDDKTTDTDPTGQANGTFASPVGDVLLPLLLMAFVYTVVRFWRNRKLLLKSK